MTTLIELAVSEYSCFTLDVMAAMLEKLKQKNLINSYCIRSLFFSNMAAESLSCKSLGIDCKVNQEYENVRNKVNLTAGRWSWL